MTSHAASPRSSAAAAYPSRRELRNRPPERVVIPRSTPAEERVPVPPPDPISTVAHQTPAADPTPLTGSGLPVESPEASPPPSATDELLSVLRAVSPTALDAIDLASVTAWPREDLRAALDSLMSQHLVTATNRHSHAPDHPVQILYRAS
jgi:hypothetical protein